MEILDGYGNENNPEGLKACKDFETQFSLGGPSALEIALTLPPDIIENLGIFAISPMVAANFLANQEKRPELSSFTEWIFFDKDGLTEFGLEVTRECYIMGQMVRDEERLQQLEQIHAEYLQGRGQTT